MKHIFLILLTFLTLNSFSQSKSGQYFNEKIASEVYSRIDSSYYFKCCKEDSEKNSLYYITLNFQTSTNCFIDSFSLDDFYYTSFDDEYLEKIGKDFSNYYIRYFSEKKRKSFTKSCWTIDKKIVIEDNMSDGDGLVCATTYLKITFYFQ